MSCKIKLNKISVSALFESNINKQFLVEEYHITRIFDEAVRDINNLLNNINTNNYVYSGWCFDNKNYQCIKSEQEIYHPIYVKTIYDKDDLDIFSIKDRKPNKESFNTIYITKNTAYQSTKYGLIHEFRHAVDMYITEYNLIKNEIRDSVLDETDIDYILLNEVKYDKQLLMKSEQDAQIDATIHYLEDIKNTEEYKNVFKHNSFQFNIVSELAILGKEYDKVLDYNKMIKDLNIYYGLERYYILYILYLIYNEHIKYTKEDIINAYKNYNNLSNNYIRKIAQRMLNIAETNKRNYFKNLYDRIATHIVIK